MKLKTPHFWWTESAPFWLQPFGRLYGAIVRLRHRYTTPHKVNIPVICVGNFVAGGAGKTPTAIAMCQMVRALNFKPVIVSRGYGGRMAGPCQVNPDIHTPFDVGDEPILLASHASTVVAKNRVQGAELAKTLGDLIIMDDGLQNPSLDKTLSIAVVDGAVGVGNAHCIPAGPLRAPLGRQIHWVDAVVIIDSTQRADAVRELAWRHHKPVFTAHTTASASYSQLRGKRVLLYTGLGRPEKVRDMLAIHGAEIVKMRSFPDHYEFTAADATQLLAQARAEKLRLVTTAKDHVRLMGHNDARKQLADMSVILDIQISFDSPLDVERWLEERVKRGRT